MPEDKDEKNVQEGEVSKEETSSKEKEETKEPSQTQPLSQEVQSEIQKIVSQTLDEAKEQARREIQSTKDKAKAEVEAAQRRAQLAETTLLNLSGDIDPERAKALRAEAELQVYRQKEIEDQASKAAGEFSNTFHGNIKQFITSLGIDPNDKRIDYADEVEGDYLAKQRRILDSVAKIQKESASAAEDKQKQAFDDLKAELRKDLGIDSVSTETSPAPGGKPVFTEDQIADREFYEKHREAILEAQREGRIVTKK